MGFLDRNMIFSSSNFLTFDFWNLFYKVHEEKNLGTRNCEKLHHNSSEVPVAVIYFPCMFPPVWANNCYEPEALPVSSPSSVDPVDLPETRSCEWHRAKTTFYTGLMGKWSVWFSLQLLVFFSSAHFSRIKINIFWDYHLQIVYWWVFLLNI